MTRALREAQDIAEQMGLKVVSVEQGARHYHMIVENKDGVRITRPISYCGGGSNYWDTRNMRGCFKRFAKGLTHGLKVLP